MPNTMNGDEDTRCNLPKPKKPKNKENKEKEAIVIREDNVYPVLSCEQWKKELLENQYVSALIA